MTFKVRLDWNDNDDKVSSLKSSVDIPFGLKIEIYLNDNVYVPYLVDDNEYLDVSVNEYSVGLSAEFNLEDAKRVAEEYVTYQMLKYIERF